MNPLSSQATQKTGEKDAAKKNTMGMNALKDRLSKLRTVTWEDGESGGQLSALIPHGGLSNLPTHRPNWFRQVPAEEIEWNNPDPRLKQEAREYMMATGAPADRVYRVKIRIGGLETVALLDSGAGVNAIKTSFVKELDQEWLAERIKPLKMALVSACTTTMQTVGRLVGVDIHLRDDKGRWAAPVQIRALEMVERLSCNLILGGPALEDLGIVMDFKNDRVGRWVGDDMVEVPIAKRLDRDTRAPITNTKNENNHTPATGENTPVSAPSPLSQIQEEEKMNHSQ